MRSRLRDVWSRDEQSPGRQEEMCGPRIGATAAAGSSKWATRTANALALRRLVACQLRQHAVDCEPVHPRSCSPFAGQGGLAVADRSREGCDPLFAGLGGRCSLGCSGGFSAAETGPASWRGCQRGGRDCVGCSCVVSPSAGLCCLKQRRSLLVRVNGGKDQAGGGGTGRGAPAAR